MTQPVVLESLDECALTLDPPSLWTLSDDIVHLLSLGQRPDVQRLIVPIFGRILSLAKGVDFAAASTSRTPFGGVRVNRKGGYTWEDVNGGTKEPLVRVTELYGVGDWLSVDRKVLLVWFALVRLGAAISF